MISTVSHPCKLIETTEDTSLEGELPVNRNVQVLEARKEYK